jgi:hypothetical protein
LRYAFAAEEDEEEPENVNRDVDEVDQSRQSGLGPELEDDLEVRETGRSPKKRSWSGQRAACIKKRRKAAGGSGSPMTSPDRKQIHTSHSPSGNGGKEHRRVVR